MRQRGEWADSRFFAFLASPMAIASPVSGLLLPLAPRYSCNVIQITLPSEYERRLLPRDTYFPTTSFADRPHIISPLHLMLRFPLALWFPLVPLAFMVSCLYLHLATPAKDPLTLRASWTCCEDGNGIPKRKRGSYLFRSSERASICTRRMSSTGI